MSEPVGKGGVIAPPVAGSRPLPGSPWSLVIGHGSFFPALLVVYLFAHCVLVSARRPFWMDELLTFTIATDPSLPHALDALSHGADVGFPLPYALAWVVGQAFPATELTFRLWSSACMAGALVCLWATLRQFWGTRAATVATVLTTCGSTLVLYQNSEFRFYGLLFLLMSLAVRQFARFFAGERCRLWTHGLLHAALVLCHPFGLLYAGVLGVAALAAGRLTGVRAWPLALSGAAGMTAFGVWAPAFVRQAAVIAQHSHLPRPGLGDLIRVYLQLIPSAYYDQTTKTLLPRLAGTVPALCLLMAVGLLGVAWSWRVLNRLGQKPAASSAVSRKGALAKMADDTAGAQRSRPQAKVVPPDPARTALLVLAAGLVLAPLAVWGLSLVGKPIFLHRYLMPSVLGFAILYAAAGARFLQRVPTGVLVVPGALFAAWPMVSAALAPDGYAAIRARAAALETAAGGGLPVVCNTPHQYWPLRHYSTNGRFWFLLDREIAYRPGSGSAAADFNLATALARFYPREQIVPAEEFLRRNPRFLVENAAMLWVQERVEGAPERFRIERAGAGLPENAALVSPW